MSSAIELLRHFSVPIYSCLVEGFDSHKEALGEALRGVRAASPGVQLTNRNSWHSEANLHLGADPEIRWATDRIRELATGALHDLYQGWRDTEPRIVDCWSVIGGRGAWHTAHQHYPRLWSGVFYVSAERCVSATDPTDRGGKVEFLNPISVPMAFFTPPSISYNPRDGLLLLFPGALLHMVHPNPTDEERVIMSFNIDVVQKSRAVPST